MSAMSTAQTWDPSSYARNARFVSDLGSPVVELLAPKPYERILDLGCGDGVLTKKLADMGCEVVAVDSSAAQIEAARELGLNASAISGEACLSRASCMVRSRLRTIAGKSAQTCDARAPSLPNAAFERLQGFEPWIACQELDTNPIVGMLFTANSADRPVRRLAARSMMVESGAKSVTTRQSIPRH